MRDRPDPFEWSGGHPALDFVNTLDERPSGSPIENLATYRDLVRFAELARLIEPAMAARLRNLNRAGCARVVKRARTLREHLHDVLAAAHSGRPLPRSDLEAIAAVVQAAHGARALVRTRSSGLVGHGWAPPLAPEIPLHACALAVERLLVDVDRIRIRKCGASDCDVYYVDTSKGHRRQWCSMKNCGNREKQRRWRSGAP
ncbi:MAG: CGNR zinc finger domain-containing protein [Candidatus Rokuibacteriota bacterium]